MDKKVLKPYSPVHRRRRRANLEYTRNYLQLFQRDQEVGRGTDEKGERVWIGFEKTPNPVLISAENISETETYNSKVLPDLVHNWFIQVSVS